MPYSVKKFFIYISLVIAVFGFFSIFFIYFVPKEIILQPIADNSSFSSHRRIVTEEKGISKSERIARGDYFFKKGFYLLALGEYEKSDRGSVRSPESLYKQALSYKELYNLTKAREKIEEALKIKNDIAYQILLGRIFISSSNFVKAKNYFLSLDLENQEVQYFLGLLNSLSGNHSGAKYNFNKSAGININPKITEYADKMLNAYSEFSLFPEGSPLHLKTLLARAYNQVKEYEIAVSQLKNILKEKNDYRDAWIMLGYAYFNLGKINFSLDAFLTAYNLDSSLPETQYFLGIIYNELGKYNEAVTYLTVALKNGFKPSIQIKRKLADIYLIQKNYKKAADIYEETINLDSKETGNYIRPVWIYIDFLKNSAKALELSERALEENPRSAMAYNLIGWSYIGLDDYLNAEKNLKKALQINPNLAAAHLNLGKLYKKQSKKNLALNSFSKAYQMDKMGSIGSLAAQLYNELIKE